MASIKIGIIGLGRMGHAIAHRVANPSIQFAPQITRGARLPVHGSPEQGRGIEPNERTIFQVFAFDPKIKHLDLKNVTLTKKLKDLAAQAEILWLMVPAGQTVDDVIKELLPHLKKGSILIDGGNSNFQDSVRRYKKLKTKNINFLDCGTSGGLQGEEFGFSLMVGGDKKIFKKLEPIFKVIAAPQGYAYMGPPGSGHFVKMIHNGIEYALLQSYAEGFNFLENNKKYKNLDLKKISQVWNNGSIIRSWILQLAQNIFAKDQKLKKISGEIGENLTGRWTLEQAKKNKIKMPMLQKSLEIREWSRETGGDYATKLVAMLRHEFGGHEIKSSHPLIQFAKANHSGRTDKK